MEPLKKSFKKKVLSEIYQVDFENFKYQRKTIIGILLMTEKWKKNKDGGRR